MGVTMESKNCSIDFGYGGFYRLRTKVAELADGELGGHYRELNNVPLYGREEFFERYDNDTLVIVEKNNIPHGIVRFIYSTDCGSEISVDDCKQIYEVVKDYNDDIRYGYAGRSDCAMFKDFKELVKDCIDNECVMKWF